MSLSDNFNLSALKDTYNYSCFLARLDEYRHLMTYSPSARLVHSEEPTHCFHNHGGDLHGERVVCIRAANL